MWIWLSLFVLKIHIYIKIMSFILLYHIVRELNMTGNRFLGCNLCYFSIHFFVSLFVLFSFACLFFWGFYAL